VALLLRRILQQVLQMHTLHANLFSVDRWSGRIVFFVETEFFHRINWNTNSRTDSYPTYLIYHSFP